MFKSMVISGVMVMMLFLMLGCVEFAWNTGGHLATQAPKIDVDVQNRDFRWGYAPPLISSEVVNSAPVPVQNQQPQIIVITAPQQSVPTMPTNYVNNVPNSHVQLVNWGSVHSERD